MPDNEKLRMMPRQEEQSLSSNIFVKTSQDKVSVQGDEESLTPFSDSEASLSSSKSPDHSPRNSNLTLEQFTDIVLAQEKLEGEVVAVTVDDILDKSPLSVRGGGRPAGPAKLKPVVLTPRQAHGAALTSHLPLRDRTVRDQVRHKLEFVIRKNEEILENNEALRQVAIRRREKPQSNVMNSQGVGGGGGGAPPAQPQAALPLNLTVRKDLMRTEAADQTAGSHNISVTLEKLLARHGGDLEITRKVKKDKSSPASAECPPVVNLTPLYQRQGTKRLMSPSCNNNGDQNTENVNAKKLKVDAEMPKIVDVVKRESALDDPENSEKIKKIISDFRIALQEDLHGNFPLHNAVLLANTKLVTRYSTVLVALRKSVDILNRQGLTPLHIAVNNNQPGIVKELLKCGGDPSLKNSSGETCYHLAAGSSETVDCLSLLLKFSPSHTEVNIFNDKGQTPLHMAVLTGNQALVKTLLAFGLNPDVQEARCGKTALFMAVEAGHQAIAETLLCYGASLTTSTFTGATPASLASEHNRN